MRILTADQMREADRQTIDEVGIPSLVLMENAGRQVAAVMEETFADLRARRVVVLAGRGNNGGDGHVVARVLHDRGVEVSVCVVGRLADVRGDARVNLEILGRLGIPVVQVDDEAAWAGTAVELRRTTLFVDALFGTGLRTPLTGLLQRVVEDVNDLGVPIVSIDIPSGLSADASEAIGPSIQASLTVTLAAPKLPLILHPACTRAGRLVVVDIGIPRRVIGSVGGPRLDLPDAADVRRLLPGRQPPAHKGDFGHVLVVAGSRGKTGAAHLAAVGALRAGAGLVTVATPASCQPIVATLGAEYMTEAVPETAEGTVAAEAVDIVASMANQRVLAMGPGLGTAPPVRAFVRELVRRFVGAIVLDADGLTAFAGDADQLAARDGQTIVITPHPGEMARLVGLSTREVQAHRVEVARNLASTRNLFVVLKGHQTVIATPDGRALVNPTGNPGMATGGTGDVLTGVIAGWLAQLGAAEPACVLGVYLHGAAGDLAAADDSDVSMTAGDLAMRIGDAVRELADRDRRTPERPCRR